MKVDVEKMIQGYKDMADINLQMTNESLHMEEEAMNTTERFLK